MSSVKVLIPIGGESAFCERCMFLEPGAVGPPWCRPFWGYPRVDHHQRAVRLDACLAAERAAAELMAKAEASDGLRELLALAYSGFECLYTDDGCLQDSSRRPFIDWRIDTADEIKDKLRQRGWDRSRELAMKADKAEAFDLLWAAWTDPNPAVFVNRVADVLQAYRVAHPEKP